MKSYTITVNGKFRVGDLDAEFCKKISDESLV